MHKTSSSSYFLYDRSMVAIAMAEDVPCYHPKFCFDQLFASQYNHVLLFSCCLFLLESYPSLNHFDRLCRFCWNYCRCHCHRLYCLNDAVKLFLCIRILAIPTSLLSHCYIRLLTFFRRQRRASSRLTYHDENQQEGRRCKKRDSQEAAHCFNESVESAH